VRGRRRAQAFAHWMGQGDVGEDGEAVKGDRSRHAEKPESKDGVGREGGEETYELSV